MNTLGSHFSFTSFGESHGAAVGGVLDGVPAGIRIDMSAIRAALDRRSGRSHSSAAAGVSSRSLLEPDHVEWLSGVLDGITLGTPIAFIIRNAQARPQDYDWLLHSYRPAHADKVYEQKYGIRDIRGGGRSSARETAARVVGGEIARTLLLQQGIHIRAQVVQIGSCTNPNLFSEVLSDIQSAGDSIGGIVRCVVTGLPVGWGDPVFDKLSSRLAFAMLSINACKGFDYGSGFEQVAIPGSEMYLLNDGTPNPDCTGGVVGGISDGTPLAFRCVFKPTPSSARTLQAIAPPGMNPKGRFDVCVAIRAVPIVEAMTAMVLADYLPVSKQIARTNGKSRTCN